MPENLLLVDDQKRWSKDYPDYPALSVNDYLTGSEWTKKRRVNIINLCRDLSYQSLGYYASLLAEARGHRIIPSVSTLHDLSRKTLYGPILDDLDEVINKALHRQAQALDISRFEVMLHFGQCESEALRPLARKLYEAFRIPLLRVEFARNGRWRIRRLRPGGTGHLSTPQQAFFIQALSEQLRQNWKKPASAKAARYDLAILYNPEEVLPPSDSKALQAFIKAGAEAGINAELITARDFGRLLEYDALFIRETTGLNHHTYRFARKAANEGLVVIDDPDSIRRCVNKIFLSELLSANQVPIPGSVIIGKHELTRAEQLGYPVVLKIPDGSFSRGMVKAASRDELEKGAAELFRHSGLILAQAYTYTEFDWRVGILNGEALFGCRYYMSRGHWQIVNHADGKIRQGKWDTLPIEAVPVQVVETALKAARLIGDGLYGVDMKQTDKGVLVIEVNDNPNIDQGVEDQVLGKKLYQRVMGEFRRRLDKRFAG
ncbi:MAG: RimK family protein [Thiothrix sp.]|nr:RimK family protein [Thiothrix sp.]